MNNRVLEIFKEITAVPRGSENMVAIAAYCVNFAQKNNLKFLRDNANNVVIYKDATTDKKESKPIILQAHLDMVCQVSPDSNHNFLTDGPQIIIDGDFLKANKTTLGADNGIGVAIILAILESKSISHPPIEAVLTTDEEIGMIGATALDMSVLKSKRMINLDSEEDDTVTVSCAGGSDFKIRLPIDSEEFFGTKITLKLFGLKGGHSGVDINKGRVNANVLSGRILNDLYINDFRIVDINGGDKCNAITTNSTITIVAKSEDTIEKVEDYLNTIKAELSVIEPDFDFEISSESTTDSAFSKMLTEKVIYLLLNAPSGVVEMSAEIPGLVETSLNLGILSTNQDDIIFRFALRSNKLAGLDYLEENLTSLANSISASYKTYGHYPPWEYKADSKLQEVYAKCFTEYYGFPPKIEAIHAGLECGVFDSQIEGLNAIAVGPQMYDVHTVNERLSISSTNKFFDLLLKVLETL